MIKKIVNKLAIDIINKRGSGDSCIYTDVDRFIFANTNQWKIIDEKISYDEFVDMVRKKLNYLYKIEFNILPCFKTKNIKR